MVREWDYVGSIILNESEIGHHALRENLRSLVGHSSFRVIPYPRPLVSCINCLLERSQKSAGDDPPHSSGLIGGYRDSSLHLVSCPAEQVHSLVHPIQASVTDTPYSKVSGPPLSF